MSTLKYNDTAGNIQVVLKAALAQYPNNQNLGYLTACQAVLESGLENNPSQLAIEDNNLFGIKGMGTAGQAYFQTHEYEDGKWELIQASFSKNNSVEDSFAQHARVFEEDRYANLWNPLLSLQELADLVHQDGYATDPKYPSELISVYERNYANRPITASLPSSPGTGTESTILSLVFGFIAKLIGGKK